MAVVLRPISPAAAAALRAARTPDDVRVAPDHPTEFSAGIARQVGTSSPLGPFFVHREEDDVVVGEIGGGFVAPGVVEIGYAVVPSCWGRGYATGAVRAVVARARAVSDVERMIAHTPLDRPASGRVLEKAGFTFAGEEDDEHEGTPIPRSALGDRDGLARAAGHGGQDHERVALRHARLEPVEHAHVLVVEVDVDVAVELALTREELGLGVGVLLGERGEHGADVLAGGLHLLLTAHGGAQHGWDLHGCHGIRGYPAAAQNAS